MNVTTERSKEKPMSTIDSETNSKPAAHPKVRRKPVKNGCEEARVISPGVFPEDSSPQ